MKDPAGISAVILAGGYSSRMGREKAELLFHGKTFVQHQTDRLRSLGVRDIILSGYGKPVPGTHFVPDVFPHRGPLSGIHAGLLAAGHNAALILAVDTPLVPSDLLAELIDRHNGGITLVSRDGKAEPLIGIYDTSLADLCETLLREEKLSLRQLLSLTEVSYIEYRGDASLLMNCNTPEDYRRLSE